MWAVLDQALFAGTNFVVNLVLARWLAPEGYGAFSVAFSIFLLFGSVHTAVITEPMLVFGSGKYRETGKWYLRSLTQLHWALTVAFAVVTVLVVVWSATSEATLVISVAVAAPMVLYKWMMRKACYIEMKPRSAALAGCVYFVIVMLGLFLLQQIGRLYPPSVFLLMGGASLAAGAWIHLHLHLRGSTATSVSRREIAVSHWMYGRWSLATSGLTWLPGNVYFLLLPAVVGIAGSGTLRALLNVLQPPLHIMSALGIALLPTLVRLRSEEVFPHRVRVAALSFLAFSLIFWVVLGVFGRAILGWLYDGAYTEHAHLFWILGLLPICSGVTTVLCAALRAIERPDMIFWSYVASASVTLTVGVIATSRFGVGGAVLGMAAAYFGGLVIAFALYRRITANRDTRLTISD